MDFTKTTEQDSHYNHLEQKSISELLQAINTEDQSVPKAVKKALPKIEILVKNIIFVGRLTPLHRLSLI